MFQDFDMNLEHIKNEISNCRKCSLWKTRTKTVSGGGNPNADILFIGEAPGRNEDLKGQPFVGRAGKVLDELLESIDLSRDEVFIANVLKCRPPNNRNPLETEIKKCTPYLTKQIEIIQPKIIVTLGSFATNFILDTYGLIKENISKIHGKKFEVNTLFGKLIIIPVFHPAVVTYDKNKMVEMKKDFKVISNYL